MERNKKRKYHFCKSIVSKQKDGSHRLFVLVGVTGNILLRNLHCLTTQALCASVPVCAPPACKQSTGLLCRDGRHLLKVRTLLINFKTKRRLAPSFCFGRSDRVRTCGLNIPNVARYQLRHTPKILTFKNTPKYYNLFRRRFQERKNPFKHNYNRIS